MIELMLGTYGVLCWLVFKKWKLVPVNTYTVFTAILIAVIAMTGLLIMLIRFHPSTKDGRLYAYTTPVLPLVRGKVIEVMPEGANVKEGDILFKIDPTPYQFAVDRLEAQLEQAKVKVAQLVEDLKAAESATEQARANLKVSESDFDFQARENLERAKETLEAARQRAENASTQAARYEELLASGSESQSVYDAFRTQSDMANAEVRAAEAAKRQAEESIKSGSDRLNSVRQALAQAEVRERQARLDVESIVDGVSPEMRAIMADLESARFDLESTIVRAPADGFTTQVTLRPGQMAVPMPLAPVMIFVHADRYLLMASLPQNVMANIETGLDVEMAFKAYPGRIFQGTVNKILPITPEGQLSPSGQIRALTPAKAKARVPIVIEYDDTLAELNLPPGSQATVAVYTHHVHALSIIRKILLRIKGWENYIFMP